MSTLSLKVKLANDWTVKRVEDCLNRSQRHELVRFIHDRYKERFLQPIRVLSRAESTELGFGFAVMALCSLLIETIECYREGLPTSADSDLKDLCAGCTVPKDLEKHLPKPLPGSKQVFVKFFDRAEHKPFFPDVPGELFYTKIRCGLLHQAQTKGGWRIKLSGKFWDVDAETINRNEFAIRLEECFDRLLDELRDTEIDKGAWPNVCRKLQWLTITS